MTNCTCLRCGYTWVSRVEQPKCCPHCKSRVWNVAPEAGANLEVDVSLLKVGDQLEAQGLVCGNPDQAKACTAWLTKVVRAGRRLGFNIAGELESGQPPRARRIA